MIFFNLLLQYRNTCAIVYLGGCKFATPRKEVKMLKFKGFCAERNIKQTEIAQILNITVQSVSRKMNGKEPFTLEQVKTLCSFFQISADEYFI